MRDLNLFQIIALVVAIITLMQNVAIEATEESSDDYYIESERKANYFQAWNNCSTKHMRLVTLDTKEKTQALTVELRKVFGSNHPNIWIGGNDMKKTGQFVWMMTNQPFTYTNWASGQPDNYRNVEHCVMLWDSHDYLWNDGDCLAKISYVCEKKA